MGNLNIVFTKITSELVSMLETCRKRNETFIDCGAGVREFGMRVPNVISIDVLPDPETKSRVFTQDARSYNFRDSDIPLFIRPNDGSWVYETIKNAFNNGCKKAIIITKEENFDEWDDEPDFVFEKLFDWVGDDGEKIFVTFAESYSMNSGPKIKTPKRLKFHLFSDGGDHEEDIVKVKKVLSQNLEEYDFEAYDTPEYADKFFDVLLFDWGGMSLGNEMLDWFSRNIIEYIREHPSKIVVIISEMTKWAFEDAMREFENEEIQVFYGLEQYLKYLRELYGEK